MAQKQKKISFEEVSKLMTMKQSTSEYDLHFLIF